MNISRVNLNLLVVLQVLLETCNTTRAAEKLCLTQSTVSNALSQLRALFDDPLFVRKARGLTPTEKALQLQSELKTIIQNIEDLLSPRTFDPKISEKTFMIGMSDFCQALLLNKLQKVMSVEAPFCKLMIKPVGTLDFLNHDEAESYDLLIGVYNRLPQHYDAELILQDEAVCLGASSHELMKSKSKMTLKKYLSAKHIAVYYGENPMGNMVDTALKQLGYEREVDVWMPHALSAVHAVINTNYLVTLPKSLAVEACKMLDLSFKPLQFVSLQGGLYQVWHKRTSHEPSQLWLRERIKQILFKG